MKKVNKEYVRTLKDMYLDGTIDGYLTRAIAVYIYGNRKINLSNKYSQYEKQNGQHSYTKSFRNTLRLLNTITYEDILKIDVVKFSKTKRIGPTLANRLAEFQGNKTIEESKLLEREKIRDAIYFLTQKGYKVTWNQEDLKLYE